MEEKTPELGFDVGVGVHQAGGKEDVTYAKIWRPENSWFAQSLVSS